MFAVLYEYITGNRLIYINLLLWLINSLIKKLKVRFRNQVLQKHLVLPVKIPQIANY